MILALGLATQINVTEARDDLHLKQSESVVFHKLNTVSLSQSQWIFSFVLELEPYSVFIDQITRQLLRIGTVNGKVLAKYKKNYPQFVSSFQNFADEINVLVKIHSSIRQTFRNIRFNKRSQTKTLKPLGKRPKRAILPIVGKALSFLFGTVTKSDLNSIKSGIRKLSENQVKLLHVVKESVSILNITRAEVLQNRHTIDNLIDTTIQIRSRLQNVTYYLNNKINQVTQFVVIYNEFQLAISEVKDTMQRALYQLNKLDLQLSTFALGKLTPAVIDPNSLHAILNGIRSSLTPRYYLPVDPDKNIWFYYKTLSCAMLQRGSQFLIIASVPLLDTKYKFDVYKLYNMPVAFKNTTTVARYKVETNYFAVNIDLTRMI